MASKTKPSTNQQAKRAAKRKQRKSPRSRRPAMDIRLANHLQMVSDPCNAPLAPTAYRGSDGIITRFKTSTDLGFPTDTAFITAFYPQYNSVWVTTSSPGSAVSTSWNLPGPGQSFLLSNADSQRPVGACIRCTYTGSELNRRGMLYAGVLTGNTLTGSYSIASRVSLMPFTSRVEDGVLECRWVPSSASEHYWNTGAVAPVEVGDDMVIVIMGTGFDSNTTFNLSYTGIYEWRPKFNTGFSEPTANTPDVPAGLERLRTTLAAMGNWMYTLGDVAHNTRRLAAAAAYAAAPFVGRGGYLNGQRLLTM